LLHTRAVKEFSDVQTDVPFVPIDSLSYKRNLLIKLTQRGRMVLVES